MASATTQNSQPDPVRALYSAQDSFLDLLVGLKSSDWSAQSPCPGWSVQDVVSHVSGTERLLSGDPLPEVDLSAEDTSHVSGGLAEMNEAWVVDGRRQSPSEALATLREAIERRRSQLEAMTDDELDEPTDSPIGRVPYRDFMGVRAFDTAVHELDVRDAVGLPGRFDGDEWQITTRMMLGSLGRTVGKKAQAPDGSRVRIALEGYPAPGAVDVVVSDGRGAVGPVDESATPTTTLTCDYGTFVRATCGRNPGEIRVDGDAELGRRVVENLAFVQ